MASATEILDQYVRDSRYETSSKVPQAGKPKTPKISNGGTATASKSSGASSSRGVVSFKKLFDRM